MKRADLRGKKFGRLTALKWFSSTRGVVWVCVCRCNNQLIEVNAGDLVRRSRLGTQSCGCLGRELTSERNKIHPNLKIRTTHKLTNHPLYSCWHAMKVRCYNQNCKAYKNYGRRGITVCDRWLNSFQNFYDDMFPTWQPGLTIERNDNHGPYCPENCSWETHKKQNQNRRSSKITQEIADKIRKLSLSGVTGIALAKQFNTSRPVVSTIINNKAWI